MKAPPDGHPRASRHPIAVVAERTGLSQDVLRVWERRYGVVSPKRGPGGQRLYSDADVERLALLHAATRAGRGISQVAALTTPAIAALVDEDTAARERRSPPAITVPGSEDVVDTALQLARALEGAPLNEALRRAAMRMGISTFLEAVAAPLLRRVGDEWHARRLAPAHEHLVSTVLHDIIAETMRSLVPPEGAPGVLVTTPAGDRHSIGAALVGAAAAVEGWKVLYLGADLPAGDIADAARAAGVRVVAVSIVYVADRERVLDELRTLRSQLPKKITLIAGGSGAATLADELTAMEIRVSSSVPGLVAELRRDQPHRRQH